MKVDAYSKIMRPSLGKTKKREVDAMLRPGGVLYVKFLIHCNILQLIYTSSSRASRGRKFQKTKELYSKERICL